MHPLPGWNVPSKVEKPTTPEWWTIMPRHLRLASLLAALALVGTACAGDDGSPTSQVAAETATTAAARATTTTSAPPATTTIPTATTTSISEAVLAQISDEALRDIPYAEDSPKQVLDVYLPATGDGPYPTILAIHGGGFNTYSKDLYRVIGPWYAANGYAFVTFNYRLTTTDSYPAQIEDSFCALAWLHANADEYGFDPDRVMVTGGSSGGYMAAMVGTVDDTDLYLEDCPNTYPADETPQAVVILYGFYDFTTVDDYKLGDVVGYMKDFWGADYEDIPVERLKEMSPIAQIDGSEPPFILLHGTADKIVPSVMSERFAAALEQAGVDVELVLLPDVGHAFMGDMTADETTLALAAIHEFLERTLNP
jgi:acetyl esterase/lipase